MKSFFSAVSTLLLLAAAAPPSAGSPPPAADSSQQAALAAADKALRATVAQTITPLMRQYGLPGMAVGVWYQGRSHIFNFGEVSRATHQPVSDATLFEIGSLSKTFTVALTAHSLGINGLAWARTVGTYFPALRGTPFGQTSVLALATHTTGELPLQVPDDIRDDAALLRYLAAWKPESAPGSVRTYSNVGVGMLGRVTAAAIKQPFREAVQQRVLAQLGLNNTFYQVPPARLADYAQGYSRQDAPIRVSPGMLDAEAYGLKSTAGDLLRFVAMHLHQLPVNPGIQKSLDATRVGYFRCGPITQDPIWEQYPTPVSLNSLLAGNADTMALQPHPAQRLSSPQPPQTKVWVNKTGSTNGFGGYIAFLPAQRLGLVLLANKNYPNAARITAAHAILSRLSPQSVMSVVK